MSKIITQHDMAHIVSRLLLQPVDHFSSNKQALAFLTDIAEVVTKHCNGEVILSSTLDDDDNAVTIDADIDTDQAGGIWEIYDPEGCLHDSTLYQRCQKKMWQQKTFIVCRNSEQVTSNCDTMLQVDYTDHCQEDYEDFIDSLTWQFLTEKASFTHTEVADLVLHLSTLMDESGEQIKVADSVPEDIKDIVKKAHDMGMTWILFHLGQ